MWLYEVTAHLGPATDYWLWNCDKNNMIVSLTSKLFPGVQQKCPRCCRVDAFGPLCACDKKWKETKVNTPVFQGEEARNLLISFNLVKSENVADHQSCCSGKPGAWHLHPAHHASEGQASGADGPGQHPWDWQCWCSGHPQPGSDHPARLNIARSLHS